MNVIRTSYFLNDMKKGAETFVCANPADKERTETKRKRERELCRGRKRDGERGRQTEG